MVFEMLRWWYGTGWLQAARRVGSWLQNVKRVFSVGMLTHTLFAPWHRIVSISGRSLDARMRAALDNSISRCVGFVVRIFVLVGAGISLVVTAAIAIAIAILWPLLPLAFVYFLVRSITG